MEGWAELFGLFFHLDIDIPILAGSAGSYFEAQSYEGLESMVLPLGKEDKIRPLKDPDGLKWTQTWCYIKDKDAECDIPLPNQSPACF